MRSLALLLVTGCHAAATPAARAPDAQADVDPKPPMESARWQTATYERHTEHPIPTAGGLVRIHAPIDVVFAEAIRFKRYWELITPYLESSNEVAANGQAIDLYVRGPRELGLWATLRFRPVDRFAYDGAMIDGNMEDLHIAWELAPAGPNATIARLELRASPAFYVPKKLLTRFARNGVCIMLARFTMHVEAPEADATVLDESLPCMIDTSP